MTRTKSYLLLDVGGTFVKGVLMSGDGQIVKGTDFSIRMPSNGSEDEISQSLCSSVERGYMMAEHSRVEIRSIGIAIPGPFDYCKGIFMMKHKFQSVYGKSVTELLGMTADIPVRFIHDVNCMLLGEMKNGIAKDYANVSLVTLGTGLGFATCIDRQIILSPTQSPGIAIYNRPHKDGILEDYISKRGLLRLYREFSGTEEDGTLSVADIGKLASGGDKSASATFVSAGEILAESIAGIINDRGIECLLFGGQISRSFRFMEYSIRKGLSGCSSLKRISQVSDIDRATFYGLYAMLEQD